MDDTPRIIELRKKLEKDPGSRVFAQLAEELRKDGRLDEAIEVGRSGLERHPKYPSARLTVARALLDSGRPSEARPELEQVLQAAPDNILASRLLAEALDDLGEPGEALRQFEQTLQLSPGDKGLVERIAGLKSKVSPVPPPAEPAPAVAVGAETPDALRSASPAVALPSTTPQGTVPSPSPDAALPSALPDEALPSARPDAALPSALPDDALPSALPGEALLSALPDDAGLPPVPEATMPEEPAVSAPVAGVALDRDLASGTFSPGTLKAADLQEHFDRAASEDTATLWARPPSPPGSGTSLPAVEVPETPALDELPSVEVPADSSDVGAATLPLTSLTLADLYLQQGLKAEASAVLSQVMKEEPENAEARSKFAAVSVDLDQSPPADAPESPALATTAAFVKPSSLGPGEVGQVESRHLSADIRDNSIASLKAFLSAVEREALQQRATERGAL